MNGFLCDVLVCDEKGTTKYYTDLPRDYVMQRQEFRDAPHLFVFHLSYGFDKWVDATPRNGLTWKAYAAKNAANKKWNWRNLR